MTSVRVDKACEIFPRLSLVVCTLVPIECEFLLCVSVLLLPHFLNNIRLKCLIYSFEWYFFLIFFGDILEMFTYRFRIIPNIFFLCLSVFGSHPYWDSVNNVISPALHESSFLFLKQLWDVFTLVPNYSKFCLYLLVFLIS